MTDRTTAKLARRLTRESREASALRQAVVDVDNGDGTVDLTIGGSTVVVPSVAYLASYTPTAGDTVWVYAIGPDLLVLGKQA